ncbi:MAG: hypothetical protein ACHQC8_02645 [Solirubrobacterales bacterium]
MKRTTRLPIIDSWHVAGIPDMMRAVLAPGTMAYQREVHDGHLSVLVSREPHGWHLSISHRTNEMRPRPGRYPTWDEVADARYRFIPDEVTMAMLLPPREQYVNLHETTFHLNEVPTE